MLIFCLSLKHNKRTINISFMLNFYSSVIIFPVLIYVVSLSLLDTVIIIIIIIIIIILIKRYSLTRVKLTALYKHLITKTTLTFISANKTLIIVA